MAVTWKPKSTRPDRKWSHLTLIIETERYIKARNADQNPPLLPEVQKRVSRSGRKPFKPGLLESTFTRFIQPRAERRKKTRPEVMLGLCAAGMAVLFVDVLSLRSEPGAEFYLTFLFGILLFAQGIRLLTRIRW